LRFFEEQYINSAFFGKLNDQVMLKASVELVETHRADRTGTAGAGGRKGERETGEV